MKSHTNLARHAAAVLALGAAAVMPAAAGEPEAHSKGNDFKFEFVYSSADLQDEARLNGMIDRLESRVKRACRPAGRVTLPQRDQVDTCVARTMADTIEKIGSATVAEAYRARTEG